MKSRVLIVILLFISFVSIFSSDLLAQKADPCRRKGMYIKNLTTRDLWHKRNGGACRRLGDNKIFIMKPEESIDFFSDMTCETRYCVNELTYKNYKTADDDGNCRVKILPECELSDM